MTQAANKSAGEASDYRRTNPMKLYLISQTVNRGYDTYNAFVVCAESEEDAKMVIPLDGNDRVYGSWVKSTTDITVEYLGEAVPHIRRGEILGSFNAG